MSDIKLNNHVEAVNSDVEANAEANVEAITPVNKGVEAIEPISPTLAGEKIKGAEAVTAVCKLIKYSSSNE